MNIQSILAVKNPRYSSKSARSDGFSLVEVTMAIGLVSFCLVAMLGVLPVGLSQERKSHDQMLALQALGMVSRDLENTSSSSTNTSLYEIAIPSVGGATRSGILELDGQFSPLASGKVKEFEISYRIEPPASKFASYRFSVRAIRSSQADASGKLDAGIGDYVESVILKAAL